MAETKQESANCIGFVTVRQSADHGYFGGYLIVNCHGRPLEFHCTLPLKPSRAQEILYGSTLDDFICGEQITKALITKAKLEASLIFTDCPAALASRLVSEKPIALIQVATGSNSESTPQPASSLRKPAASSVSLKQFSLGHFELGVSSRHAEDDMIIKERWKAMKLEMDLLEPFERIAEALLEAHPTARAA